MTREVDRRAQQRRLDHLAALQQTDQFFAIEVRDAGPEPDVHRRCVLRLEPTHPLKRGGDVERHPVQQQLAREQRPMQIAPGENPLQTRNGR